MTVEDIVEFHTWSRQLLDLSDLFFATELDIDDPTYAVNGESKGKRVRCFLQKVDDRTARETLEGEVDQWLLGKIEEKQAI